MNGETGRVTADFPSAEGTGLSPVSEWIRGKGGWINELIDRK